jgi:hypothetical protein
LRWLTLLVGHAGTRSRKAIFFKTVSELIMSDGPPLLHSMGLSTCPFYLSISWAGFLVQIWLGGLVTGCFH